MLSPADLRDAQIDLRKKLNLKQPQFADRVGIKFGTYQPSESPTDPVRLQPENLVKVWRCAVDAGEARIAAVLLEAIREALKEQLQIDEPVLGALAQGKEPVASRISELLHPLGHNPNQPSEIGSSLALESSTLSINQDVIDLLEEAIRVRDKDTLRIVKDVLQTAKRWRQMRGRGASGTDRKSSEEA